MQKNKKILFSIIAAAFVFLLFFYRAQAANVPNLSEGTYLSGQTLSVWPSWSLLGNELGKALPTDPINQLALAGTCAVTTNRFCVNDSQCPSGEKCVLHDPVTGWSVSDRRFSFACSRDSYAYRYIVASGSNKYTLRARLEDTGLNPGNFNNFVAGFVSTSIVKLADDAGICNFDQEISTLQSGVCGDGRLNQDRGEQCDPPGAINYQAGCVGGIKNLSVCNNSCQWIASTTLCSNLSACGNGVKESGEACDDGRLNGKYNHCNISCNGFSPLGRCGNGSVETAYEVCDPGTPGMEQYSVIGRQNSCSWDCQSWGPYCGDGIIQDEYESCDGDKTCTVGGQPGVRVCTSVCQKQDERVVGWWSLEKITQEHGDFFTDDISSNNNVGYCAEENCPLAVPGHEKNGMLFSSGAVEGRYIRVAHDDALNFGNTLTVDVWINPSNDVKKYQRILEKGGPDAQSGFALEFNADSTLPGVVRFSLWNGQNHTAVDSVSVPPLNTWTHIAATLESQSGVEVAKIYINGNLENTTSGSLGEHMMRRSEDALVIGSSQSPDQSGGAFINSFFGMIDEVKVYNRPLSADAIKDNVQNGWFCNPTITSVVTTTAVGTCGNGVVDANEACDKGAASNGRACVPTYNHSCSYCAANCQNVIDVQPAQYCGNGVIEDVEKCDYTSDGTIYAAATTDGSTVSVKDNSHNGYKELSCAEEAAPAHTIKKGVKTCGECSLGTVKSCTVCGMVASGVGVSGSFINVLSTSSPSANTKDPLFANALTSSSVYLSIGYCSPLTAVVESASYRTNCDLAASSSPLVGKAVKLPNSDSNYVLQNPYGSGSALVSSEEICSAGEDRSKRYLMYLNRDWTRPFNFSVVGGPQTWQYDFVLSPLVRETVRSRDVRVVISWVGPEDFIGGLINPFVATPEINGASFCNGANTSCANSYLKKYATGVSYYTVPNSNLNGVWYHGLNTTIGQTNAESFTIDTSAMSSSTYAVYVKAPSVAIRQFKNTTRLKAEVYLPESDQSYFQLDLDSDQRADSGLNNYRFGTPVKTYYFQAAAPSDNQNAKYWQIFNIIKPGPTDELSIDNLIDINTIMTGPAVFNYRNN